MAGTNQVLAFFVNITGLTCTLFFTPTGYTSIKKPSLLKRTP